MVMYCMSSFITLITPYVSTIPFLGHVVAVLFLTVFQTPDFFVSGFSSAPPPPKGKKVGNDSAEPIHCCRNWF